MSRFRILRYMPPEQMMAADMLIRQSNKKVIDAIMRQCSYLASLASMPDTPIKDDDVAWLRFYKPATGQEWFISRLQEEDLHCLYYCGEFSLRSYHMDILRMKEGLALDIYWSPKSLTDIKRNHVLCECNIRAVPYARIMRKGSF